MSNYLKAETQEVNDFIAARRAGKFVATAKDAKALCADWHDATCELREFDHITHSFEDLADEWHDAINACAPEPEAMQAEPRGEYDAMTQIYGFGGSLAMLENLGVKK
jgi:hypothetical protein